MQGRRVIVLGASGQDGPFVEVACRSRGAEVFGFSRRSQPPCDVSNYAMVDQVIREYRPDYVFHLAAESRTSHDALFDNHGAIAGGAVNVLEAVRHHVPKAKVLLAGSGLQFRNAGQPIRESDAFEASSPYSAARIYATYLARYFRQRVGLSVYVAYLFHHESPARSERHTSMMIAMAAVRAMQQGQGMLELGDISVEKEWAYAGDIAEGMIRLISQDDVSECVIGTGEGHSIGEWLALCYGQVGLDWRDFVKSRHGFVAEYPRLVSDPATIMRLGWRLRVGFSDLAQLMMDAARQRVASEAGRQV